MTGSSPWRRHRGASCVVAGAALAVAAAAIVEPATAASPSTVPLSVHLLPAGQRISIVVDFEHPVGATKVDLHQPNVFGVDIGPVSGGAVAEVLRASSSHLVREVRIDPHTNADRQPMIRVQVTLQPGATGSVRVADRRVYLDFAPPTRPPASTLVSREPAVTVGATGQPEASPKRPVPSPANGDDSTEGVLERAKALAKVPDVRGLVELRARVVQGGGTDAADGARQEPTLAQLDAYLAEAQRLQLAKDAQLFRTHQVEEYKLSVREVAADLDAIGAALRSPDVRPATLVTLRAQSGQLASRLHAMQAPSELANRHAAACAATDEVAAAFAAASADDAKTAAASVAIERARSALKEIAAAASLL